LKEYRLVDCGTGDEGGKKNIIPDKGFEKE
jgi:hypothetical protein